MLFNIQYKMQTEFLLILSVLGFTNGRSCSKFVKYEKSGCKKIAILAVPNDFSGMFVLDVNVAFSGSVQKEIKPIAKIKNVEEIESGPVRHLIYSVEYPNCSSQIKVTVLVFNGNLICREKPLSNGDKFWTTFRIHYTFEIQWENPELLENRNKRHRGIEDSYRVYDNPFYPESNVRQSFASNSNQSNHFRQSAPNPYSSNGYGQSAPNPYSSNGYGQSEPNPYSSNDHRQRGPNRINRHNARIPDTLNNSELPLNHSIIYSPVNPDNTLIPDTINNGLLPSKDATTDNIEYELDDNDNNDNPDCGLVGNSHLNLINGGQLAVKGDFPWTVAIFLKMGTKQKSSYICAGNQISNKHIITAGHCTNFRKHHMFVVPGIIHLDDVDDIPIYEILAVDIHPNYRRRLPKHDVAIITVTQKMRGMPICLWPEGMDTNQFVSTKGVVLGWGRYDKDKDEASQWLKMIQIPIVSQETCIFSDTRFRHLITPETFCAGDRDMTGPCSGDSGGGFNLKIKAKYYLRGVVSTAISKDKTCDLSNYVIFTDIAKHMDWVKRIMNQ